MYRLKIHPLSSPTESQMEAERKGVMDTGIALEIIHAMATAYYKHHGGTVTNDWRTELALKTAEDFIVNNFEED